MKKATFIGLILIGLIGNRCKKSVFKEVNVLPIDTLTGEVVLKGDTSNPTYRTHYLSGNFRIDPEGNLWISDLGGHRLLKYNPEGEYQNQIIFYPESTIISKESPKIDVSKIRCDLAPVAIVDFSFDKDGNLYVFLHKKDFLSENWKGEMGRIKKGGTIHTYELDPYLIPLCTVIDSKNHIYIARRGIGTPTCPDLASILIIDSVGNKIGTMGSPLIKTDWNMTERHFFNYMHLAVDKEDNLWVAFLFQPIVRKYNSQHRLLWERKYLTAETKEPLAKAERAHRQAVEQQKRKRKYMRLFPVFHCIEPLPDGRALLFVSKGIVYELNEKGNICRKLVLKGAERGRFYAVDNKGDIWKYKSFPSVPEKKISGITIYRYRFSNLKVKRGEKRRKN